MHYIYKSPHKDRSTSVCVLSENDLQHHVGYNSLQTEFPARVVPSFHNALDRMESTTDVPCLKTDIFGCDFWIWTYK